MASEFADAAIEEILQFWFGSSPSEARYAERRKLWFSKNPELDQEIRDRFMTMYEQAIAGELEHWQQSPQSCLALLIVLDQFSRNMFRNAPRAFAADTKALSIAKTAIDQGLAQQLEPIQRIFMYLPLEHSENLEDQLQSVKYFRDLAAIDPEFSDVSDYAVRHYDVIKQFGRFPHRNAILGRDTTPEEAAFLQQPGSSF